MITCERCGKSFQAKPNKDGSFNGFGLQKDDGTFVNVCAQCFNILMGMPLKQIKEFVEGADRNERTERGEDGTSTQTDNENGCQHEAGRNNPEAEQNVRDAIEKISLGTKPGR